MDILRITKYEVKHESSGTIDIYAQGRHRLAIPCRTKIEEKDPVTDFLGNVVSPGDSQLILLFNEDSVGAAKVNELFAIDEAIKAVDTKNGLTLTVVVRHFTVEAGNCQLTAKIINYD